MLLTSVCQAFEVLPLSPPTPKDNPMTAEKIQLGKQLFFDPRLSASGTISCNSCHNLFAGGEDGRAFSIGVMGNKGSRSAPTVWNAAFLSAQFWDGRVATLEEQAKGPILNPLEMGMPSPMAVIARLKNLPGYVAQFQQVFPTEGMTFDNLAKAIAAYERTLITPNSPFDRFLNGDGQAISTVAKRGMKRAEKLGCTGCHRGANFSGPSLPVGLGSYQQFPTYRDNDYVEKYHLLDDIGRYAVTKDPADKHVWRVPTWRNVAVTAPYFHNGSVKSLDEAVRVMAKTQLNKELKPSEVKELVEFLQSLTGEFPEQQLPRLPLLEGNSLF